MEAWKQRLYASYVSTGQATGGQGPVAESFDPKRYRHLDRLLCRVLPASREIRILDLACGHGPLLHCARGLGYTRLAGVDVSGEQVAIARQQGLAEVVCEDLREYLRAHPNAFDVVVAMDVLEHLTMPELLESLDLVFTALAPAGRLVVHVPNAEGIFGMRARFGDLTHETAFTPSSISQLLHATGFNEIQCHEETPTVHGFSSAMRHLIWRTMTLPARLLLAAETGHFGHVLSQNMLVLARKAGPSASSHASYAS